MPFGLRLMVPHPLRQSRLLLCQTDPIKQFITELVDRDIVHGVLKQDQRGATLCGRAVKGVCNHARVTAHHRQ